MSRFDVIDAIIGNAVFDKMPANYDCPTFINNGKRYVVFGCGWPLDTDYKESLEFVKSAEAFSDEIESVDGWVLDMEFGPYMLKKGAPIDFSTPVGNIGMAMELPDNAKSELEGFGKAQTDYLTAILKDLADLL